MRHMWIVMAIMTIATTNFLQATPTLSAQERATLLAKAKEYATLKRQKERELAYLRAEKARIEKEIAKQKREQRKYLLLQKAKEQKRKHYEQYLDPDENLSKEAREAKRKIDALMLKAMQEVD